MSSFFLHDFKCSQFLYIGYLFNNSYMPRYAVEVWGGVEKYLFTSLAKQK